MDDQSLLSLVKKGDERAFREIYDRFHDFLYVYAYRLTGDDAESRDILQTLFANLWANRDRQDISGKLFAYLHRGIRYGFLNQERNKIVVSRYRQDLLKYLNEGIATTEEYLFEKELIERLRNLAEHLPGKQGKAFILSYFDNYSHAEIADALGISEKTVKNLLSSAARDIRLKIGLGIALFFLIS